MTWLDYVELAASTDRADMSYRENFAHASLMLVSEYQEVVLASSSSELAMEVGDCLWAIAKLARVAGIAEKLDWPTRIVLDRNYPEVSIADIAGYGQKLFQGHMVPTTDLQKKLSNVMSWLSIRASLQRCAEMNIQKLKARFPDGFSEERSVNRK